jgi:hypothetical protein
MMNTKIYIGLARRSVIPYVECGNIFLLLIFEGSSMELVMGENISLKCVVNVFFLYPSSYSHGLGCLLYAIERARQLPLCLSIEKQL